MHFMLQQCEITLRNIKISKSTMSLIVLIRAYTANSEKVKISLLIKLGCPL